MPRAAADGGAGDDRRANGEKFEHRVNLILIFNSDATAVKY